MATFFQVYDAFMTPRFTAVWPGVTEDESAGAWAA
jgi:hypothetical protein